MANDAQWIAAVLPEEIVRQRQLGWPDFHPEDFCHRCGRRNPVWYADAALWNEGTAGRREETGRDSGLVPVLLRGPSRAAERETAGLPVAAVA